LAGVILLLFPALKAGSKLQATREMNHQHNYEPSSNILWYHMQDHTLTENT